MACDSSPEAAIISLEYNGKLLRTPSDRQRIANYWDHITCRAKGTHIVWEMSLDGIEFIRVRSSEEDSRTAIWTKSYQQVDRNAAGILTRGLRVAKYKNWHDAFPYIHLRCKAIGFPPFESHAISEPIIFQPREYTNK